MTTAANHIRFACLTAAAAVCQFVVAIFVAVAWYPDDYSFSTQYLSELGCCQTSQPAHALVFGVSLGLLGLGLCYLFGVLISETFAGLQDLLMAAEFGFGSSASVLLLALLPYDVFPRAHNIAMLSWIGLLIPMFLYWIDWCHAHGFSKQSFVVTARMLQAGALLTPIAVYLTYGSVMQKLLVLLCFVWLLTFCSQVFRLSACEHPFVVSNTDPAKTPSHFT